MVATRGQMGSDGPATSTPGSAAPVIHTARPTSAPTPDAGTAGRNEGRTTSADLMRGATSGGVTTQAGSCTMATQANPTTRLKVPWLPTDEETETEPEDLYSQGDRLDPNKDRWEKTMGGAVGGTRHLIPPRGHLLRDPDCREEETNNRSQQSQYGESRPFRLRPPAIRAGASATITRAAYGEMDECCDPEDDYYSSRDP